MNKEKITKLLERQIELLEKWNESMEIEPEQVRKNTKTIFEIATYIYSLDRKINL